MPIIQENDSVSVLIRPCVVVGRGAKESKVHEEFRATMRYTLSCSLSGLFSDVGLFFKIYGAERVVFEDRGRADDMPWEHVELLFAGETKAKCPNL